MLKNVGGKPPDDSQDESMDVLQRKQTDRKTNVTERKILPILNSKTSVWLDFHSLAND